MTAWYCSNTEPYFRIKGNRPRCLFGAVSLAMTSTERAMWEKTDSTIMTASVPHRPGAHSMLRFQPESNVQYDGYIIQSNRSLHLNKNKKKAMCLCDCKNQQMGWKGILFLYNNGSDKKLSLFSFSFFSFFLFWQMVVTEYKCTSTNVW